MNEKEKPKFSYFIFSGSFDEKKDLLRTSEQTQQENG
jgi:hypothetical protein